MSLFSDVTRPQLRTFLAAWTGWVLDAFDFTIFLLVMPHIEAEFGVKHVATTASIALTLLARLAGGYFAGKLADRVGRKLPMLLSIVWFALCDGAVALAPSFTAILVLRTLFGFGMGAEWTSGTTLAMENWPAKSRGVASGILQGSWAVGYLLAAVVSAFVVPRFGWRGLFVVAALPALLVLPMRYAIPESDEWKRARGEGAAPPTLAAVFRKYPSLLRRTLWASAAMSVGFGAYYALTGLYPSMLITEHGATTARVASLVAFFNVGMMLGAIASGYVASRRGAAIGIAVPATLSLVALPLYVGAGGATNTALGVGAFFTGAFGAGFSGVTPLLLTGLFPAEARARLVGIVYHVGAFFAGFVPLAVAWTAKQSGLALGRSLWFFAAALEVALVLLVVLGREGARTSHGEGALEVSS